VSSSKTARELRSLAVIPCLQHFGCNTLAATHSLQPFGYNSWLQSQIALQPFGYNPWLQAVSCNPWFPLAATPGSLWLQPLVPFGCNPWFPLAATPGSLWLQPLAPFGCNLLAATLC